MQPMSVFAAPMYAIRHGAHRTFMAMRLRPRLPRRLRPPRHAIRTVQPAPPSLSAPTRDEVSGRRSLYCLRILRRPRLAVDPEAQLLADLEKRHALGVDRDQRAGLRAAALAGLPLLHHEAPEAPDLDALAAHQRLGQAVEHLVDDDFGIAAREPGEQLHHLVDEIALGHGGSPQAEAGASGLALVACFEGLRPDVGGGGISSLPPPAEVCIDPLALPPAAPPPRPECS